MNQQGMSLIQLLFVLLIVALSAQFASPAYNVLIEQQRRQVAAQQLVSSLRNARVEALVRHQTVVVHALGADWSQGWQVILDVSGRGHQDQQPGADTKTRRLTHSNCRQYTGQALRAF